MMSRKLQAGLGLALGMALVLILVSPAVPSLASVVNPHYSGQTLLIPGILLILGGVFSPAQVPAHWCNPPRGLRSAPSGTEVIDLTCSRLC